MQRVHISPGKALCRYCGEHISMNQLSAHIASEHPRPGPVDRTPTLVRKPDGSRRSPR